jgi:2-hydroxychromene-2-carboxylate isomerase
MTLTFSVFWSMRSPFCYVALDRLLQIRDTYDVIVDLRVVYPVAIRNPHFFETVPGHYRPYHLLDSARLAEFHGIPYRRPVPDPIVQDMETSAIAEDQPYIRQVTRLAALAGEQGKGLDFQAQVMRLLWDGQTDGWDEGSHLADAMTRAGLDADALLQSARQEPEHCDAIIEANQEAQASAGHPGVPLFVFEGEPFFGQDRLDLLVWRMKQAGLSRRM